MDNPSPRNLGILLSICTGMRIGEICALQWRDIDIVGNTIHVNNGTHISSWEYRYRQEKDGG